jgi:Holliday junction resolvase RusA-like endonuclease
MSQPALEMPLAGRVVSFDVLGVAAPKGSARAMRNKYTGAAMLVPSGSGKNKERLRQWDANVREAAAQAIGERDSPPFVEVPLDVSITFYVTRPASHWSKRGGLKDSAPQFPACTPDVDKLARGTLDALTGIVFDDDGRIARLTVEKVFAKPGHEGARIRIAERAGA